MRSTNLAKAASLATMALLVLSTLTVIAPFGKASAATSPVSRVSIGLLMSDSLKTGNTSYWTFGGDAASQSGAKFAYSENSEGLHIGVQSPAGGTWSGYYAHSPNSTAYLYHSLVTLTYSSVPDNGFNTGIYVQTWNTDFIDYVGCLAVAVPQGTYWVVVQAYGVVVGSQVINTLYQSSLNALPLTQDCTIITNGNNYLKVYLGGNVVVNRNNMTLNMPLPLQSYLEPQTSTASSMLYGTYTSYYETKSEGVTVTNAPAGGMAQIVDSSNHVLASAAVGANGSATMLVGKYNLPLNAFIKVFDSSNKLKASTSTAVPIWGGDVYSAASSTSTTTTTSQQSSLTIQSKDQVGNPIYGYYITLYDQSYKVLETGYTTVTFSPLTAGTTYIVEADGYGSCSFAYWQDTMSTNYQRTFSATSSPEVFTAVYSCM
jgi:hypothetical protein